MDARAARFLVSIQGRAHADGLDAMEGDWDRRLRTLRRTLAPWQAAALVDQARGRASLMRRHPSGKQLFATAHGAAQSSSFLAAAWRARRYEGCGEIADLGAGLGVDALALSSVGRTVALEKDPAIAILLRANLEQADAPSLAVRGCIEECEPATEWAFCDPDRRSGGRRTSDPEDGSPPLSLLVRRFREGRWKGLAVKLSPAAPVDRLQGLGELEFVSIGREMKEIVLWMGALSRGQRRVSFPDRDFEYEGSGEERASTVPPATFVHRPDPALLRAGLAGVLATELGVFPLDDAGRLFTGNDDLKHPGFRSMPILAVTAPSRRKVQALVNASALGPFTATRCVRGRGPSPEEFLRGLKKKGGTAAHFFLTTIGGRPRVVVARAHGGAGEDGAKSGAI